MKMLILSAILNILIFSFAFGQDGDSSSATVTLDTTLVSVLEKIFQEDQKYRQEIRGIIEKYGQDSDEMKAHFALINQKDSINLIKVKEVLDKYGWLGVDVVGVQGNMALFLVIQHADLETQEKYLPMMREAVKEGRATASNLALLEDRVAIKKGGKQIYGSQVGRIAETGEMYVLPLADPDNVNQRRAEVGLGTMEENLARFGMVWDVEEYKKKLPEYEKKMKR